ncbi:hypothetical protein VPH35_081552 [Triticum aestivum]
MGVARGGRHLPSSLFDPGNLLHLHHHLRSLPVHVTHLFPFAPTPLVLFPRPGRLLVARSRVSLAASPLFIPPPRGRRRAQDTGGSPVSPVVSWPPFLAIEPAESDALSFPGSSASSPKVTCEEKYQVIT